MLHDVHIYATVKVKVSGVEAADHAEAIRKAEGALDLHDHFESEAKTLLAEGMEVTLTDYAEEVTAYLVDEAGDDNFLNSRWYKEAGVLL